MGFVEVDLRGVACDDHFGAVAETGEEHHHLVFGCVLCFIEDDERVIEGAAAHEGEGDDFDEIAGHETLDLVEFHHIVEGIEQWAEVWIDFVLHSTGEEAELFTGLDGGAYEYEFADFAMFEHGNGGGDGEVGFACTGGATAEGEVVIEDGVDVVALAIGCGTDTTGGEVNVELICGVAFDEVDLFLVATLRDLMCDFESGGGGDGIEELLVGERFVVVCGFGEFVDNVGGLANGFGGAGEFDGAVAVDDVDAKGFANDFEIAFGDASDSDLLGWVG